jgi:hypothetical protein
VADFAHVGQVGFKINGTFLEADGVTPVVITGETVVFRVLAPDGADKTFTATIDDGPNGVASYTTTDPGDLHIHGRWLYQGHVTFSGGHVSPFKEKWFDVYKVLPGA